MSADKRNSTDGQTHDESGLVLTPQRLRACLNEMRNANFDFDERMRALATIERHDAALRAEIVRLRAALKEACEIARSWTFWGGDCGASTSDRARSQELRRIADGEQEKGER